MARAERKGIQKTRPTRVPELGYYIVVTDPNETEANPSEMYTCTTLHHLILEIRSRR